MTKKIFQGPMEKFAHILILSISTCVNVLASRVPDEAGRAFQYLERARDLYDRSEYDSLPWYYGFSGQTFDRLGRYDLSAACMLGMVDYYRMSNWQSAAALMMDSAERYIVLHLGRDSESWPDALYTRAKLCIGQNRDQEAIALLNSSIELRQHFESDIEKKAKTHGTIGVAYYTLGDIDSAEYYYRLALSGYQEISSGPSPEKGRLLFNLALVYSRRNDRRQWAEYTREGIDNDTRLFGPGFPDLASSYNSLSSYFIASGRLDSARHYLDRADSVIGKAYRVDNFELSRIIINRARIYRYEGNYLTSLEYYIHSLEIQQAQEIPLRSLLNATYLNIGQLYSSMGDFRSAKDYFSRLLESEGMVHPVRMATFYFNLAEVQIKLGNYREAEDYLKKIMAIRDRYPFLSKYAIAFDYQTYGILMDSTGRSGEAGEYFRKALELARINYGEYDYRTATIYKALGDHYLGAGDFVPALEQYQQAIHCLVPAYDVDNPVLNADPATIPNLLFYLAILKQKAAALESLADAAVPPAKKEEYTRAAFSAYNLSVQVIETLRTSYLNDESKLFLSANERPLYEKGVKSAFRSYDLTGEREYLIEAFRIAEKGKYATLQSVLHREDVLRMAGIPDSLRVLDAQLKKQLSVYQELLAENRMDTLPDEAEIQQLQDEVFHLNDRIAGLHRMLESDYPEYYSLLYSQQVPDPENLAKKLRRSEKIIEYFIAGSDLYIFEISRRGFTCRRDSLDAGLLADLDRVERYTAGNSIRDTIQDQHLAFISAAYRLNSRLVPASGDFRDLIIIPEGKLSYFPFDVLVTEPVEKFTGSYYELPFLIRSHAVRYGYSATLLARKDHEYQGRLKPFVGFAPGYLPLPGNLTEANPRRDIKIDRSSLEALPGSVDEVIEIGKLLGGEAYTGNRASEGRFKEVAGQSHIIHLATHTFIDDEDPLRSKMVFSDNPEFGEDGLLNVYELYNMDLKARMVVLSACNTGTGKMIGGEGIMSLSRAFFYAGVHNVVMTLWTVTDQQSHRLMLTFYDNLRKGRRAEISLRKAKLDFMENALPEYQHPRYWAGFILAGDPEPLFMPRLYRQLFPAAGILLLLAGGFMLLRRFLKKGKAGI